MNLNQFECYNCNHDWFRYSEEDNGPEFCPKCEYLNAPIEAKDDSDEAITELDQFFPAI